MQGEERKIVILGEHLRVQVKMSEDDTYGIFLRNLVAKGGTGTNNVTLIDRSGCPVEVKLMREDTQQIREVNPWKAIWRLLLPLEADVEMYLERCQPVTTDCISSMRIYYILSHIYYYLTLFDASL
ncbi:uncharacterized protein LOC143244813 isoform X2 [Tachypleus tridentatus]|uniref:uncharacterized protein LOC143244813 isoform X2 n=1 Tax=Tachypleus tridentatus TaxID=6853 RepID=UPI003FCFAA39